MNHDAAKHRILDLIRRRHPEWREHQLRWRWLLDSLEGGDRYRQGRLRVGRARGLPIRNLIRHKREYPDLRLSTSAQSLYLGGNANGLAGLVGMVNGGGFSPGSPGSDSSANATDDDYELRRARTPDPDVPCRSDRHPLVARFYAREVTPRRSPTTSTTCKPGSTTSTASGTALD